MGPNSPGDSPDFLADRIIGLATKALHTLLFPH